MIYKIGTKKRAPYNGEMQITMTDTRILSIPELKKWLSATESFHFETHNLPETYAWMDAVLRGYRYAL